MTVSRGRSGVSAGSLLCSLAGAAFLSIGGAYAGDAVEGRKLAEMWCVSCHTVSTEPTGRDTAPPFTVLAREKVYDRDRLLQVLSDPHPPMPRVNLSRHELDDVVSYIKSLAPAN